MDVTVHGTNLSGVTKLSHYLDGKVVQNDYISSERGLVKREQVDANGNTSVFMEQSAFTSP